MKLLNFDPINNSDLKVTDYLCKYDYIIYTDFNDMDSFNYTVSNNT